MKKLTVIYGDTTVFDGDVEELQWTDRADEIAVVGRMRRANKPSPSGLLDVLTNLSKAKTEAKRGNYGDIAAPVDGVEAEPETASVEAGSE